MSDQQPLYLICIKTDAPQAEGSLCPGGYTFTHLPAPMAGGELSVAAGAMFLGAAATFYGFGIIFNILRRGP
ncbi:hypothetical protein VH570_17825 [Sphingobium sp. HT1-2]|jgi:hypothetical protein|uniref:hypothetical protein n=1 Tax=Sphingobium sp. HT1-2 TaxID=3111640 RepID=UPI003BFAA648